MIKRSKEIWMVAYFLCKYAQKTKDNSSNPPTELTASKWTDAYRMFYDSLSAGRTVDAFEHSLKNTRDAFDAHLDSNRVGWHDRNGQPAALNPQASRVMRDFGKMDRQQVWEKIRGHADPKVISISGTIDDLAMIQEMEEPATSRSLTEGGISVVISVRYERNIALRDAAFREHGYDCAACGFNYQRIYGDWGKGFAEVHHLTLVSSGDGKKKLVNPKTDLIVLCANCHRMVHRKKNRTLTLDELSGESLPKHDDDIFTLPDSF